jgi:hypothetical protein
MPVHVQTPEPLCIPAAGEEERSSVVPAELGKRSGGLKGNEMSTNANREYCPVCRALGHKERGYRIPRRRWMHCIPGSRLYICDECSTRFLTIGNFFRIKFRT